MPSGLSLPLAFGMNTLLMGSGRYMRYQRRRPTRALGFRHLSLPQRGRL